jgi:hypothetical protein
MTYTVELYKKDSRTRKGERLDRKVDHSTADRKAIEEVYAKKYPASKGYRFEIHETYVKKHNLMGGGEFTERYDTPHFCSPSSESYWSM